MTLDVVGGVELKHALNRAGCSCGRNNRTEDMEDKDDHTIGLAVKSQAFQRGYSLCHLSFGHNV